MDTTRFETLIRDALDRPRDERETYLLAQTADEPELRAAVTVAVTRLAEAATAGEADVTRFETLIQEALERPPEERETFLIQKAGDDATRLASVAAVTQLAPPSDPAAASSRNDATSFDALVREAMALDAASRETFLNERTTGDPRLREEVREAVKRVEGHLAGVDIEIGDTVGPYVLKERLGEGGMGAVYLAHQTNPVERFVALKCIKPGIDSKELLVRFESERRALAIMSHPNVATVFDAGVTPRGRPYFAMEYVPGVEITDYCDRKTLNLRQRVKLFIQACEGVEHAHQKGIIHRDLKPSNVLVAEKSERPLVKIIDFGIAKSMGGDDEQTALTRVGGFIGTPLYASPEQAEISDAELDTRTDVYSLGVILYELLVGRLPFNARAFQGQGLKDIQAFLRDIEPPTPESRFSSLRRDKEKIAKARALSPAAVKKELRGDLGWIVMRALEKARDDRYASVDALIADLERYLDNQPVEARAPTLRYRALKFVRRHKVAVTTASLIAIATIGVAISSTVLFLEAREQRQLAEASAERAERATEVFFDMLRSIEPEDVVDGKIDADALIRDGAKRIEAGFSDVPEREAALILELADLWNDINPSLSLELIDIAAKPIARIDDQRASLALEANSLMTSARIADVIATPEEALSFAEQGLAKAQASEDVYEIVEALEILSIVQQNSGKGQASLATLDRKLAVLEESGAALGAGDRFSQLGHTWLGYADALGFDDPQYESLLAKAEDAFTAIDDGEGLANITFRRAELAASSGNYALSIELYASLLDLARSLNEPAELAYALFEYGEVLLDYGDLTAAEEALEEARPLASGRDDLARILAAQGQTLAEQRRFEEARVLFERAIEVAIAIEGEGSALAARVNYEFAALEARLGKVDRTADLVADMRRFMPTGERCVPCDALVEAARLRAGLSADIALLSTAFADALETPETNDYWTRYIAAAVVDVASDPDPRWIELSISAFDRDQQ